MFNNKSSLILIVDDIPKNLHLLAKILSEEKFEVILQTSGKDALQSAETKLPDLILLDVLMPEMDGIETCKKLKENQLTKDIPVIFLTAKNESEDVVKGFNAGAVDYIFKPFHKMELLARIKTHLELKKAQKEVQDKNTELRKILQEKDRFFSILAHDIKNPVYAQSSFMQYIFDNLDNLKKEDLKHNLAQLSKASTNTAHLLDSILDWVKTTQGKMDFKPHIFELNHLINETIKHIHTQAELKSIKIFNHISNHYFINADLDMMLTVMRNIASNAIKFTKENGSLYFYVDEMPTERKIKICVKDTGVGIKQDKIEKIFSITGSYKSYGTNNETGSGLGLILCKELLEKNGAQIGVESVVGEGSVFFVIIDIADDLEKDF